MLRLKTPYRSNLMNGVIADLKIVVRHVLTVIHFFKLGTRWKGAAMSSSDD